MRAEVIVPVEHDQAGRRVTAPCAPIGKRYEFAGFAWPQGAECVVFRLADHPTSPPEAPAAPHLRPAP